ncbi:Hypothetical protein NTJ_15709 [Nesidiocoris tenuis]|uniref:Uncharacterized protein n=1 Tax=Nesidiocoris tenuis TaxID=355587 RepID=A0ABN7BEU7_9HEMI|nr:Hypothetical protein NTJ_15709 [Nesidiocoris tenuis]
MYRAYIDNLRNLPSGILSEAGEEAQATRNASGSRSQETNGGRAPSGPPPFISLTLLALALALPPVSPGEKRGPGASAWFSLTSRGHVTPGVAGRRRFLPSIPPTGGGTRVTSGTSAIRRI